MFRKLLDQGEAGDNVGCLLRGTKREEVERARCCASPVGQAAHKFKAEAYILTKEEAAPHAVLPNYRPHSIPHDDVTGIVQLPQGTEMVMPGDNVTIDVALIVPIAMEESCASPSAKAAAGRSGSWCDHRVGLTTSEIGGTAFARLRRQGFERMNTTNIRIRLKAFDHRVLDASTKEIVSTAKRTGARVRGPIPLPTRSRSSRSTVRRTSTEVARAVRDSHAQARARHRRPDPQTVDALMNSISPRVDVEIKL